MNSNDWTDFLWHLLVATAIFGSVCVGRVLALFYWNSASVFGGIGFLQIFGTAVDSDGRSNFEASAGEKLGAGVSNRSSPALFARKLKNQPCTSLDLPCRA